MSIAIVTGASSGMGREFVLQLGAYVNVDQIWVIARRREALEALSTQVKTPLRILCLDLCLEESFRELEALLRQEKPDVKLLVNAAGFGKFGSHHRIDPEQELKIIDLNSRALVAVTRIVLPYMHSGSHILQLDSLSAFQPVPYMATYAASKAFVLSYSRSMNRELKARGIRMMAMNPGWVKTEFFDHATQTDTGNEVQYFNRLYEADEVVATGLRDLYRSRKDYSVHGFPVKAQVFLVNFLPHSLVMNIWQNQQKRPKNNENLTVK